MTPDQLRAAIASARERPAAYGVDPRDLASYLSGLVVGAYGGPLDALNLWCSLAPRGNAFVASGDVCDCAEALIARLWPEGASAAPATLDAYLAADDALLDAIGRGDVRDEYDPRILARMERLDALRSRIADLEAVAAAVHREHLARMAWLATLPDGAMPRPSSLVLDAEAATRAAVRRVL